MQRFAGLTTPSAPLLEAARYRACASRKGASLSLRIYQSTNPHVTSKISANSFGW